MDPIRELHGVVHTDVRDAIVLWIGKQVMLIDFEQAELMEPPRPFEAPLWPISRTELVEERPDGRPF